MELFNSRAFKKKNTKYFKSKSNIAILSKFEKRIGITCVWNWSESISSLARQIAFNAILSGKTSCESVSQDELLCKSRCSRVLSRRFHAWIQSPLRLYVLIPVRDFKGCNSTVHTVENGAHRGLRPVLPSKSSFVLVDPRLRVTSLL